jgi:hypothetical protein
MRLDTISKSKILSGIALIAALGSLLFGIMNFYEYAVVALDKSVTGYPFGCINDTAWFYRTPSLYATYCLVSGILFIFNFLLLLFCFFRSFRIGMIMSVTMAALLVALQLWSSSLHCSETLPL